MARAATAGVVAGAGGTNWEAYRHRLESELGRSPRTAQEYIRDAQGFRRWLDERRAGVPPQWFEVGERDIREYLASLTARGGDRKPVSPARVHRIVSALRSWFDYLHKRAKEVDGNPAAGIEKPKLPKRLAVALKPHELARLLDAATKHSRHSEALRNWAILAFLYGSGLRIAEALSLTFDRVDYHDGFPAGVRVVGKGDKERSVPLSSTAARALAEWLKHRRREGPATSPYIWLNTSGRSAGRPLTNNAVNRVIKRASLDAGLGPKLSAHKLRSSYATALADQGRSIDEIKDLLGHASISTTQIYLHTSRARLEAAAASLPDVLDVQVQPKPGEPAREARRRGARAAPGSP